MTPARALVRLYPEAFREQWGPDLETEIDMAGWRSWPNTLLGIADMWLHPSLWPARSPAQRRLRTTTMAISVTALCWFVSHAGVEADSALSRSVGHSQPMSAGLLLTLTGLALIAPLPRPTVAGLAVLIRRVAARLALPSLLGMSVVLSVHLGVNSHTPLPMRAFLLACWWTALAVGAVRTCRITADLGARVVPPRPGRLRLGTWVLIGGAATNAATVLSVSLRPEADLTAFGVAAAILALIPAFGLVLRDCGRPSGTDG
ncbi:hypothetical protein AB0L06_42820 [Spirillospora sp. NPDC052269]